MTWTTGRLDVEPDGGVCLEWQYLIHIRLYIVLGYLEKRFIHHVIFGVLVGEIQNVLFQFGRLSQIL